MTPGDRLVCAFLTPVPVGRPFTAWPLHITVLPWFRLAVNNQALTQKLTQLLTDFGPFKAIIEGEAYFGHRRSKLVNLVRPAEELMIAERRIRSWLHEQAAWLVDETTKRRHRFRPHVTAQGSRRVHEGEAYAIERLSVVEQQGSHKIVVGEVLLDV